MCARDAAASSPSPAPSFVETQALPSWLVPAVAVLTIPSVAFATFVIVSERGWTTESIVTVAAVGVLGFSFVPLLTRSKLRTEVREDEDVLAFRFRPFHRTNRVIPFEEIEDVRRSERRSYQYGLRWTRWGWEYRPNASEGVEIYRTDGKPLFLGSEQPHELRTAIEDGMRRQRERERK